MLPRSRRFFLLGIALVASACQGPEPSEYRSFGRRIINGTLDTTNTAVVVLYNTTAGGMCTGTLITDDVVLTAAHCVETDPYMQQCNRPVSASRMQVGFGTYVNSAIWRGVSEISQHPNWDCNRLVNDITLLRLSSSPPSGYTPIPYLPASLAVTNSDLGTQLEFSGYGETETHSSGTRLHVNNALDLVCTSSSGCGGYASPNTICYDENPGGPCSGDSGGPAFILRSGTKYVAGVISYGDQNCSQFGCSTKVDAFEAFIMDFLGTTLPLGSACSQNTQCESGWCVDSVCCEGPCGGACQSCNQAAARGYCRTDPDNTPCSDNNACNGLETCQSAVCTAGTAPNCNDNSVCTADSCNPQTGCVNAPISCDDSNVCTIDSCDPLAGCQHPLEADGVWCSDGDACNGMETCHGGSCLPGAPTECDDANPCTQDLCDPGYGCVHANMSNGFACDDGNVCNGADNCISGACTPFGPALVCDDRNSCTQDGCDPALGCRYTTLADGSDCSGGLCGTAQCQGGLCVPYGSFSCDDQNECTLDNCIAESGCLHQRLPDGAACGQCQACQAGVCSVQVTDCEKGGCGCSTSSSPAGLGLLALTLALYCRPPRV